MPLNINLQQILLHWMNLSILTGGLYFLLFKPVKQFMDKRAAYYQQLEEQASDKLAQAERLKAEAQAKLEAADDEIHDERMPPRSSWPRPRSRPAALWPRPRPRRSSPRSGRCGSPSGSCGSWPPGRRKSWPPSPARISLTSSWT